MTCLRTRSAILAPAIALGLALVPTGTRAGACRDEKVMDDLWSEYDRAARTMGCASPARGPFQYLACAANAVGKKPLGLLDHMGGYWNSMAKGGWATIGPRMLGPSPEEGTLLGTSGRTFVTTAPANTGKATVVVKKIDGRVGTQVTVCATRRGQKPRVIWDFRIDNGKENLGKEWSRAFTDVSDSFISIHLDGKSLLPTDKFVYRVRMDAEPVKWDFGPIQRGWADLHVHQAAELAHAGTMYYGGHDGPLPEALHSCNWQQHGMPFHVGKWDQYRHGNGYPTYADWPHHLDIGHQQVHASWLEAAWKNGLRLVLVSAVNNEPGCRIFSLLHPRPGASCADMPNLEAQLDAFVRFDEAHDWYEIAVDPWHARKIIHEGKLAVVLSLESSHLFPASSGDFVQQLREAHARGVRTLQPTHEVDSRFAGAAPWSGMFELLQTVKYPVDFHNPSFLQLVASLKPGFDYETRTRDGKTDRFNKVGLKPDGYRLLDEMAALRMPIDVAHMSVKATEEVHGHLLQKHRGFPMYMSHSRFGSLLVAEDARKQQEFMTSEHQIEMLKELGGMVGLRPGPQPIKSRPEERDDAVLLSKTECAGTTRSYRNLIAYGLKRGIPVALGSDFNGNTSMMGSRFERGKTGCPGGGTPEDVAPPNGVGDEFVTHGLRHIGLVGDMLADLRALDPAAARAIDGSAEAYLAMWERAWDRGGRPTGPGTMPVSQNLAPCVRDFECGEGKYCDKGWLTVGKNQCVAYKAICTACSDDKQCGPGRDCRGVIGLKRCIDPGALSLGARCCMNDQCRTGQCEGDVCVCSKDSDCPGSQKCKKPIGGKNRCE